MHLKDTPLLNLAHCKQKVMDLSSPEKGGLFELDHFINV